jgi:hypothetical protein
VADLFVKLRRVQTKAKQNRLAGGESGSAPVAGMIANNNSSSSSEDCADEKGGKQRVKPNHIECTSGPELLTHPVIIQECDSIATASGGCVEVLKRARLTIRDTFECMGGVDCVKLLRASRTSLLEKAAMFQTNALVEEEWSLCVVGPKSKSGNYRVQVCVFVGFVFDLGVC